MEAVLLSQDPAGPRPSRLEVESILSNHRFDNVDVGDLNAALDIDCWIVSIPKASTTSIQRGLERIGHKTIHAHNDPTTYDAFPNGDVLKNAGVMLRDIIRARLEASDRKIHYFFGYREPLAWWVSLAGQFGMNFDSLIDSSVHQSIKSDHPGTIIPLTKPLPLHAMPSE